jgi:hypothetical protein
MKLTNPTKVQLDAAFTRYVVKENCQAVQLGGNYFTPDGQPYRFTPYSRSLDAVRPWMEKKCVVRYSAMTGWMWEIIAWDETGKSHCCTNESFPLAIVVALLKAHGVEVEFT